MNAIAELVTITDMNERRLTTLVMSLISAGLWEMGAASGECRTHPRLGSPW